MQLSYPVAAYRRCIERAFCELLIGYQYASELPKLDRFTKFLTRLKENGFDSGNPFPGLTTTDLCKTGLPINWIYIQYNRGPLQIVEEDEFRADMIRCFKDTSRRQYNQEDWGFGQVDLNFWLIGNSGTATENAEVLYYMRLYKLRSVDFLYLGYPFRARVEHEMLDTFEPFGMHEYGTGFSITWRVRLRIPILKREVEGFTVSEICNEVFDDPDLILCTPAQFQVPLNFPIEDQEGPRETIITSAEDDGRVNIFKVDGPCPDGEGETV